MNMRTFAKVILPVLTLLLFSFMARIYFDEPTFSLDDYVVEEGFNLSVVASDPHFEAPVTMDFDDKGRMWVVEMRGYMPNLEGIGEEEPNGRITILEDLDKDGLVDHSKVFLEGLVLPRAIAHAYGGLLYTDGPALYYVKIKNDKPGKKVLVDPVYAEAGNVEHQPNGLMLNIDNWIYNANTNYRYRLLNGKWLKEPTSYRGQWGISHDNFGRLYTNNNSVQLQGDHVLPNSVIKNPFYKPKYAVSQTLTRNNKVYPLHATAVNRGYIKGVLNDQGLLNEVTASCGPLVYRGGTFPQEYDQNVFVCVPEANLIKRNLLTFEPTQTIAEQAWDNKEFIASTDEGFRPVNLFNGPDGAMYIVDMHRGIIQHKAFISQYLTKLLGDRKLDTLQHQGRILKVASKNAAQKAIPDLSKISSKELVNLLKNENGWLRDRAQQILIQRKAKSLKQELWKLAVSEDVSALHALYTLEGLQLLDFSQLSALLSESKGMSSKVHILRLMEAYASSENSLAMSEKSKEILALNNAFTDLYLAASLHSWMKADKEIFLPLLETISERYPEDKIVQEAVISSLEGLEKEYLDTKAPGKELKGMLELSLKNREKNEKNSIYLVESKKDDGRTNGLKLFRTICGACHGADGSGIADLAPPLKNSEYVNGSVNRLAAIILHGISGPLHVNGQLYQLNNDMPGLLNNTDISDQDVVDIVQYLQNAFAVNMQRINAATVKKLREEKPASGVFTEKELLEGKFGQ